jgi:hypothetical protein
MTMKRRVGRGVVVLSAVLGLHLVGAGAVWGKVLLETDLVTPDPLVKVYGGVVTEEAGSRGWQARGSEGLQGLREDRVEVDLVPLRERLAVGGTIEVELVRGSEGESETLFVLRDGAGGNAEYLYKFMMYWHDRKAQGVLAQPGEGVVMQWYVPSPVTPSNPTPDRDWVIPLEERVNQGERVRVAVTWGAAASDFRILVNGRKLKARVDRRLAFGDLFARATELVVGAYPGEPYGKKIYEGFMTSRVEGLRILDRPIGGGEGGAVSIATIGDNSRRAAGFSGKLVSGDELRVHLTGTVGAQGRFDIARLAGDRGVIGLDWRGYGVPVGETETEGADVREVRGYRVYVSEEPFATVEGLEPVETLRAKDQVHRLRDLREGVPYYVAVMAVRRDRSLAPVIWPVMGVAMEEERPGEYGGRYRIGAGDANPRAVVVGHLSRGGGRGVKKVYEREFEVDTGYTIGVETSPGELAANVTGDATSESEVTITVTDANGKAAAGRRLGILLATTSEYSGVIGGGEFTDATGGSLRGEAEVETDAFGRARLRYRAGFAAKTAIIVARDMETNDTGSGSVRTHIRATAQLSQVAPLQESVMKRGGYELKLSSSADWLTADGSSRAYLTARLQKNGKPAEGVPVSFKMSRGNGELRSLDLSTGRNGEARAVYTAGTKVGVVVVIVEAALEGNRMRATARIQLRSDAPAKIEVDLEKEELLADGRDDTDVVVTVTDVNKNPVRGAGVEFAVTEGDGRLTARQTETDGRGQVTANYQAGREVGKVEIDITVRSPAPTEEELEAARAAAVTATDAHVF